ncbi:MAG: thioesterase II family protein [Cyclobacteriaceae bacterium]|jgi:external thioesterase TEII
MTPNNLILFPYAGGHKYSFQKLTRGLSNCHVLEYSGRDSRHKEPLLLDIRELTEDLFSKAKNVIDDSTDYVVYGHSMGALVSYLFCAYVEKWKYKKPIKLILSGKGAPSIVSSEIISTLPDEEFWMKVNCFGGIPDEVNKCAELIDFYTKRLRMDFTTIESYRYDAADKLSIPIDVYYGDQEGISVEKCQKWQNETTEKCRVFKLRGGHFSIFDVINRFDIHLNNARVFENVNFSLQHNSAPCD